MYYSSGYCIGAGPLWVVSVLLKVKVNLVFYNIITYLKVWYLEVADYRNGEDFISTMIRHKL